MKTFALLSTALVVAAALHAQTGSLTPPAGPIVPTMKSLDQIDPGIALDPAQFPATGYVITQPGSYYLTGNVTLIVATEAAITINASDVTLDLRGHAIIAASGSGVTSTDSAIFVGTGQSNVTVRNGTIVGAWYAGVFSSSPDCTAQRLRVTSTNAYGIRLTDAAHVTECHVEGNGVTGGTSGTINIAGISTALHSIVKSCTAAQCAGDGIAAGSRSLVLDCAAHDNGGDGIQSFNGTVVSRAVTSRNSANGLLVVDGCAISQCTGADNGTNGFSADEGCTVSRTTASANGLSGFLFGLHTTLNDCMASSNSGEGIVTAAGCALRNCSATRNNNDGFRIGSGSAVLHCTAHANGNDPANTAADGFELASTTRVSHCSAQWNGGAGIRATSFSHYIDSSTVVLNGGTTHDDIELPNNSNIVIWNRVSSITPAPANFIGPLQDARTLKPFANF